MGTTDQRPDRMRKHTIDGQEAKIRLYRDYRNDASQFEFEREAVWSFGVDDYGIATLLDTRPPTSS